MNNQNHLIGTIGNNEQKKLIVLGGIHGNETGGIDAIKRVMKFFNTHPEIKIDGKIYFIKGNLKALEKGERFIDKDLNRLWKQEYINDSTHKHYDIKELQELHRLISVEICKNNYEDCTLLDLHTFSAESGVFCIPAGNSKSIELARSFQTPFIEKLVDSLPETALNYFGNKGITGVVFEGGTHGSEEAVNNLEAGIFHIIGYLKMLNSDKTSIIEKMRKKLECISRNFPHYLELTYIHKLNEYNKYETKEGYYNFKKIIKDEIIGFQDGDIVKSPSNGYILMPLYQKKGSDGFFIVQEK